MSTGAILVEPESLSRGTLYATALAALALTNGSRVSELLQVSATRFETIVVDETKQQQPDFPQDRPTRSETVTQRVHPGE